jgi:hypothetical protein
LLVVGDDDNQPMAVQGRADRSRRDFDLWDTGSSDIEPARPISHHRA